MNPFTYSYPTKAYFGENAAANNLAAELAKVQEGAALAKEKNIDFILAVGGGSVIDCCKIVSAQAKLDKDMVDAISPYFYDDSEHMAHCRRGSWKMKFGEGEKLPESEGQQTTCYELTKDATGQYCPIQTEMKMRSGFT